MVNTVEVAGKESVPRTINIKGFCCAFPKAEILRRDLKGGREYVIEYINSDNEGFGFVVRIRGDNVTVDPLRPGPQTLQFFNSKSKQGYFRHPSKSEKNDGNLTIISSIPGIKIEIINADRMKIMLTDPRNQYFPETYFVPFEDEQSALNKRG